MMIQPINVAVISTAIVAMLTEDARLDGVMISRSEEPNEIPQVNGWVGVYRLLADYPLRTLGAGPGSRYQRVTFAIIVQHSHGSSGEACQDLLEELLQKTLSVIMSDMTLRGTVDFIDELRVAYDNYRQDGAVYLQEATITFTTQTKVIHV